MFSLRALIFTLVPAGHCNFAVSKFIVVDENTFTWRIPHHKQVSCRREGKLSFEFHNPELLKCPTADYIQPPAQVLAAA